MLTKSDATHFSCSTAIPSSPLRQRNFITTRTDVNRQDTLDGRIQGIHFWEKGSSSRERWGMSVLGISFSGLSSVAVYSETLLVQRWQTTGTAWISA